MGIKWPWSNKPSAVTAAAIVEKRPSWFARLVNKPQRSDALPSLGHLMTERFAELGKLAPRPVTGGAFDSAECEATISNAYRFQTAGGIPDAVLGFFWNQSFLGYQTLSLLSQHWLISKACAVPARDAVRKGYQIVSDTGKDLPPEIALGLREADKRVCINKSMQEFVKFGRVFGIRVAFAKIVSTDPKFYEYPFNPDAITPDTYRGMVQVDPYWMAPDLDGVSATDPASLHFYEPTYWVIAGKRYHRSHLIIFINDEVSDLLKPQYLYGGVSVPQKIVERVYCAERTANEAPQLAMAKRLTVYSTDLAQAEEDYDAFVRKVAQLSQTWNNYGQRVIDKESDSIEQHDTSLADLDDVIMSQFQLVAAAANVPATKLLGTSPKGFNATGEFEESVYHEELESIQTNDLTPFLERHTLCALRSDVMPKVGGGKAPSVSINWLPLDTPTAKELAETNKIKADTGAVLVASGAIDGIDERNRIRMDHKSEYDGIEEGLRPDADPDLAPGDDLTVQ